LHVSHIKFMIDRNHNEQQKNRILVVIPYTISLIDKRVVFHYVFFLILFFLEKIYLYVFKIET